jgi:hypothetical protein
MVGVPEGSWGGHRLAVPRLAAKSFHVGVDVDGLACHLHWPTDCSSQACVQSHLMDVVLYHHIAWAGTTLGRLFWGCEAPGMCRLMWF